jgi:acetyl-CoA carboxylase biotin carboxylase subunit
VSVFKRTLVANRGEIALRLIRTLRDLQVESVAIFSEEDRSAAHVRAADYAVSLEQSGVASYLNAESLLAHARRLGCDSLLPGYGFLSENADFAEACADAGICFIGPSPTAIREMGDKLRARRLMLAAGVPVVPGGDATTLEEALSTAQAIGYPVMLKASHGGGGKGMRLATDEATLVRAFELAKSEALRAFGNDQVYLEKAVLEPRHVEIQVLGDQHGNLVHLFERDCSIQRRHQKVIEETPSPLLSEATRRAMTEAALLAARAVDYYSVGTLEFLVDRDERFYFLEMNTRLQVEHTVTELVTGLDLVACMLRVALGEPLPFTQAGIARRGAALQCRIYAEDPTTGFLPSTGVVQQLRHPEGPSVRVDSALYEGCRVSSEYDPLLAKLCTWGDTREVAIARMRRALAEFRVLGLKTNLGFHTQTLSNADFVGGDYDTGFIARHPELLRPLEPPPGPMLHALVAATHELATRAASHTRPETREARTAETRTLSPWQLAERRVRF